MRSGHHGVGVLDLVSSLALWSGVVGVAEVSEPREHAGAVGVDGGAGGNDLAGKVDEVRRQAC